jgi:hypothetical protein
MIAATALEANSAAVRDSAVRAEALRANGQFVRCLLFDATPWLTTEQPKPLSEADSSQKIRKARIRSKRVNSRIDLEIRHKERPISIALFQVFKRSVRIDQGD